MSTHAMLIQSMKHRTSIFKSSVMLVFALVISSCIGTSNVPVNYHLPVDGETYNSNTFLPKIEFPDGIPDSSADVVIRLNGTEIQTAFGQWGVGEDGTGVGDYAIVTTGSSGYPLITSALRDGRNGFQVLDPNKGLVTFNVDVPLATVHITEVQDNWNGFGIKGDLNNNDSIEVNEVAGDLTVKGYFEGGDYTEITGMAVQVFHLDGSGNMVSLDDSPEFGASDGGQWIVAAPGQNKDDGPHPNGGRFYLNFNAKDHVATNTRDLHDKPYGFEMRIYDGQAASIISRPAGTITDGDVVRICVTKVIDGTSHESCKKWMRSNIPLYDQRLDNTDGSFSLAADQIALKSTGQSVADILDADYLIGDPGFTQSECVSTYYLGGCWARVDIEIKNLKTNNTSIDMRTPVQNSASQAQLDFDLSMPIQSVEGGAYTSIFFEGLGPDCNFNPNSTITYTTDLVMFVNGSDQTQINATNNTLSIGNLITGGLCGGAVSLFLPILQSAIVDIITQVIEDVFNADLPQLRMVIRIGEEIVAPSGSGAGYDPGTYFYGAYLFELQPKMMSFFGNKNPWVSGAGTTWDVAFGINLGFHALGTGSQRVPSLGFVYVDQRTKQAELAKGCDPWEACTALEETTRKKQGVRTLAATLSEMFINQLMMGLWESGILYIDLGFGTIPPAEGMIVALDDVKFAFQSASPWEVDILPTDDAAGDFILSIPDLRIEFIGDTHNPDHPDGGNDYTFAYMIADLTIYLNMGVSPDEGALRLQQASAIEISVTDIFSDWDGTTPDQMIAIFDYALTYIAGETAIDIPLDFVGLGSEVDIGDVWSDDGGLFATIDVWNGAIFPKGVGTKLIGWGPTWGQYNSFNQCKDYTWLDNNIDDTGCNVFHQTVANGGNRTATRTQRFDMWDNHTHQDSIIGCGSWGLDACYSNHRHYNYYTLYSWATTGYGPAYNWGVSMRTLRLNNITNILVDGRDECCTNRMNGARVYLRNITTGAQLYVHTISGMTADNYNIPVNGGAGFVADEILFWMPRDTGAANYGAPTNNRGTDWTYVSDPVLGQATNGVRRAGDGGLSLNFSELVLTVDN